MKEIYMPYLGYKTYIRITGENYTKTPLLCLHGGPGSTHNSHELFDYIATHDKRPVIMYDQLGCGKSSIEKGHEELWNKDTWLNELDEVIKFLNLKDVHILGHSWGGMLNIMYNIERKPKNLKSIILSSTLSSASLWESECKRLIKKYMSKHDQKIINNAEDKNYKLSVEEQKEMDKVYNKYYLKFVFPKFKKTDPECIIRKKPSSKEVYETAWGPSEFKPLGTLKNYEYTERLKEIEVPVLINSGTDDESTPLQNKIMYENIKTKKRWNLYNSRHMTYFESHDAYMSDLIKWLNEND